MAETIRQNFDSSLDEEGSAICQCMRNICSSQDDGDTGFLPIRCRFRQ